MSEKSVSRRLLLFSVHNIVGLCQHVPFQDFARYNPTYGGWRFRRAGRLLRSAFDGLSEFSFHFVFHAISGLQIHKHQLRGDQQNHQRG